MKHKLVWVREPDMLAGRYMTWEHMTSEGTPADDATLEDIAAFCDMEAESANRHGMVGVHLWLALYLQREVGREAATRILREIAERGGLDELDMTP